MSNIKKAAEFGKRMGKLAAGPYGNFGGSGGATIANLPYRPTPAKDALMPYPSTPTNAAPASAGTRGGYNGLGGFGGAKPSTPTNASPTKGLTPAPAPYKARKFYEEIPSLAQSFQSMNLANNEGAVPGSPAYNQLLQERAARHAAEAAQRIAYEANRPLEGGLISTNLDMTTPGLAKGIFQLGRAAIPAARAAISEGLPALSTHTLKGVAPAAKHFGKELGYHKGIETAAHALTRGVPHAAGHAAPFAVPAHPGQSRHDLQP